MSLSSEWTNKSYTVPKTGYTYAYVHHAPSTPNKPILLFFHGFPSTSYDWRHQIPYFTSLGYGIIALDLLGYGSSSKPTAVEPYIGHSMAADIISILDHESVKSVVGLGHDWGTYLLSQLIIWYPDRIERCVFVSVPFHVPGRKTDVKVVNEKSRKVLGFETLGYWMFLTADGAGKVIGDNVSPSALGLLWFCSVFAGRRRDQIRNEHECVPWTQTFRCDFYASNPLAILVD
jgi:soluble epoxide hydrolase/lipid-phosphate phosphatase